MIKLWSTIKSGNFVEKKIYIVDKLKASKIIVFSRLKMKIINIPHCRIRRFQFAPRQKLRHDKRHLD